MIKDLQSFIKQVLRDTPDDQSTLSSSTGFTFGPMVKLGILSCVKLQAKKMPVLPNSPFLQQNSPKEENKTTLTLQIQLVQFIATFENLQLPALKEAMKNRPKCPFTFMHQSFHYFFAIHVYSFQKDVLLDTYLRKVDENRKLINLTKVFSFRHKRFF